MNIEKTVRSAALALQDAISAAQAQGYVIEWPSAPAGLSGLAISETSAVVETVTEAVPIVAADEATEVVSKPKK